MVIEPDSKFMPVSHTHLTKRLSGIVREKPATLTQSTYPGTLNWGFLAEKEFSKKVETVFQIRIGHFNGSDCCT